MDHTQNSPISNDPAPGRDEPAGEQLRGPLSRRAMVHGAAWSVPIIAAAVVTPVATASTGLVLTFDEAAYVFDRCAPSAPAVTATQNGAPAPDGTPITVTLPAGLEFADGSTSYTGGTVGGKLQLPDVFTVDSTDPNITPFTGALTATSGTATASAPATGETGAGQVSYEIDTSNTANNSAELVITNTTCATTPVINISYLSALQPAPSAAMLFNGVAGVKKVLRTPAGNAVMIVNTFPGLAAGEVRRITITPGSDGVNFSGPTATMTDSWARWVAVGTTPYTGSAADILPHGNWELPIFSPPPTAGGTQGGPGLPGM